MFLWSWKGLVTAFHPIDRKWIRSKQSCECWSSLAVGVTVSAPVSYVILIKRTQLSFFPTVTCSISPMLIQLISDSPEWGGASNHSSLMTEAILL